MEKKSLDYYACQFNSINNDNRKEDSRLNNLLDQLNAFDCKLFSSPDNSKKITFILSQCFSLVPPDDTFLVAKCCQLMLTIVGKQAVQLEKPLLNIAVPWSLHALQQSADIAFLDILQALEAIICSSISNLEEMADEIVATLCVELESKASLTTPQDVKVWRVQCLKALAPAVKGSCRLKFIHSLWQLLQQSPSVNCDADAQVVKFVLEALETICELDGEWLTDNLGDVLGVVVAFLQFGLYGWQYQKPSKLLPLPGAQWDPPPAPNIKSKAKRRQKKRVSNIGAMEVEDGAEERTAGVAVTKPGYMSAPVSGAWLTSDSELSDNEGGRTRRLRRAQAKVRLAAINLLVQVAKAVNIRELFGYYSSLVGSQGLCYNLVNDTNSRLTSVAASTTAFLLGNAKSYFAQALQSSVTSYTPFSSVLASLLDSLHQCVVRCLKMTGSMSVLHCACSLVDVTPYHRMKSGLLTPLVYAALPQLRHKEMVVSVAALTLLGCVVAVEPQTEELKQILSVSRIDCLPDVPENPGRSWVLSAAFQYLETESQKAVSVPLRVEWWQLLANMIRHHFSLVRPHIMPLVAAVLRDMTGTNTLELARLHATRTFQQLATALTSSDEMLCTQIWQKALESQLLGLVGTSPTLASVVCDCLAVMSPAAYHQLPDKYQISCMTSLLCCARDDEPVVRASALQAMASLLIYSQDEQFVCDSCDVICLLVKDPVPLVSAKAAWALGNLTDMLLKTQHGEEIISPIQLIRTSIEVAQGKVKMRANGVRALGNLLGLLRERHLSRPEYRDVPLQASEVLVKNASATTSMKVSWNACYALGSLLKNEAIHEASCSWQDVVLPSLCSLVVRSSNFKVRTNACAALACVPLRRYYGAHYLAVWKAVLDGLDNALNMSDFREVKHQDGLLEQLCLTLCHLTSLVELADLSALYEVAVYHMDTLQQHISRFLSSTVPERADAVLKAAASLALLREQQLTVTQRNSVTILSDVFTFDI